MRRGVREVAQVTSIVRVGLGFGWITHLELRLISQPGFDPESLPTTTTKCNAGEDPVCSNCYCNQIIDDFTL